jgi:hypothetical protein
LEVGEGQGEDSLKSANQPGQKKKKRKEEKRERERERETEKERKKKISAIG